MIYILIIYPSPIQHPGRIAAARCSVRPCSAQPIRSVEG